MPPASSTTNATVEPRHIPRSEHTVSRKHISANALQVFFNDGTSTDRIEVHFPIGHRERREEGIPVLKQKFVDSVSPKLAAGQWEQLNVLCGDRDQLAATAVDDFMALLVA